MDDLVERLRRKIVAMNGRYVDPADRDKWYKDAYVNPDGPEAADRIEKLEAAGQAVLDRMSGTLSNGNGVEAADGEKCWIIHSDEIEALRATITSSAR